MILDGNPADFGQMPVDLQIAAVGCKKRKPDRGGFVKKLQFRRPFDRMSIRTIFATRQCFGFRHRCPPQSRRTTSRVRRLRVRTGLPIFFPSLGTVAASSPPEDPARPLATPHHNYNDFRRPRKRVPWPQLTHRARGLNFVMSAYRANSAMPRAARTVAIDPELTLQSAN
jgi:hypothetical protein